MTVTTSRTWRSLADNPAPQILGKLAHYALVRYLVHYAPKDFDKMKWPRALSVAYKKFKVSRGRRPIADLLLTGSLQREVTVEAPKRVRTFGAMAAVTINTPYAAAQNYGTDTLPAREWMLIEDHEDDLVNDTVAVLEEIVGDGAPPDSAGQNPTG